MYNNLCWMIVNGSLLLWTQLLFHAAMLSTSLYRAPVLLSDYLVGLLCKQIHLKSYFFNFVV
jgi:hypothetical protein